MATWVGPPRSYTPGRARPIQYVGIHTTEGAESSTAAEDGAAYDKRRTDGTSTHVFADSDTAVREVADKDRSHAARFHGNEIGVHIEFCGRAGQTWANWHDGASTSELHVAAREVAQICRDNDIPVRHMTVEEVRAAYYAPPGSRPKGICGHDDITKAYPEDFGTHTDPGPDFPWTEFLAMVSANIEGGSTMSTGSEVWHDYHITGSLGDLPAEEYLKQPYRVSRPGGPVDQILAAVLADATRDAATLAAIRALAAGGTNVDTAAVVTAVTAVRDEARTKFAELHDQLAAANAEIDRLRHQLAAGAAAQAAALTAGPVTS